MNRSTTAVLVALLIVSGLLPWFSEKTFAQKSAGLGTITGTVTTDQGAVVAFRVRAHDTVHKMAYTVYTTQRRYRIYNLPPSTYEVSVIEEGFDSSLETVTVKVGDTVTVNVALTAKAVRAQGAGAAGATAQTNYGGGLVVGGPTELVDFDTIYPPSPTRDVMMKNCFSCHGPTGWHNSGKKTAARWRVDVDRMFDPNGRVAGMPPGVALVTYDRVSKDQKEDIIKYLAANLGPGSKNVDLKTDPLIRDEQALSHALFIEYEAPPPDSRRFTTLPMYPFGGPALRSLHSAWVSVSRPGIVYMSGNRSSSILAVDTNNLDPAARNQEWRIAGADNLMVQPHGIFDRPDGKVWFVELTGNHVGELDPATGQIQRFAVPTEGGGTHSIWPDSKGQFWFTYFAATGKIGRFDPVTKQTKEYAPVKDWSGYGIVTDKQDRVWAVSQNTAIVLGYDPKTDKWTQYPISSPAKRVAVDAKGVVWAAEYSGNRIAMLIPETGKVTEYELPLKYGNPYDVWPDEDNNIWIENAVYDSLVKFDPATKEFTYFPFPMPGDHTPKLDRDKEGTFWFTLGKPSGLAGFKPNGNRPRTARQ